MGGKSKLKISSHIYELMLGLDSSNASLKVFFFVVACCARRFWWTTNVSTTVFEAPARRKVAFPHGYLDLRSRCGQEPSSRQPIQHPVLALQLPLGWTPGGVNMSNLVSTIHSEFVRGLFSQATTDVALFMHRNTLDPASIIGGGGMQQQHVFCRL